MTTSGSRTDRRAPGKSRRDNGSRRDSLEGRGGGGASLTAAGHHVDTKERLVTEERGEEQRGGEEKNEGASEKEKERFNMYNTFCRE